MRTNLNSPLILAGCVLLLAAAPSGAQTPVPEEWVGIWDIELTTYDCTTNAILFTMAELDTVCSGSTFEDPDDTEFELTCTSSADADSYESHCEGTSAFEKCTGQFVFDFIGTITGDSYTATQTVTITYTGDCFGIPDSCERTETTGTRIGGPPNPCQGTPVDAYSWGAVKAAYR
ncbi:MAG: hypothetical protein IPK64_19200 [bacterium]|nr:hypothetical protein [bacterium]